MLFECFLEQKPKIYVIEHTLMVLKDGEEKNGKTTYHSCMENTHIYQKAFFNYEEAAHAAQDLIQEYTDKYAIVWDPEDVKKWDWWFIGFHHECRIKQKHDPEQEAYFDKLGLKKEHRVLKIKLTELELK